MNSSKGRALLEAYRAVSDVDDDPGDALLERIEASLETPAEPPRRAAAWIVASVAVASTVTAAVAWPRLEFATLQGSAPVTEAVESARDATPKARVVRPPVAPQPMPETELPAQTPEPSSAASKPSVSTSGTASPDAVPADAELVAELAILRKARVAMKRGDLAAARKALNEHGRAYPSGQLSEDRDALWVVLRCRNGAPNDGRAAFEATHPSSHHLVAIRAACDEKK